MMCLRDLLTIYYTIIWYDSKKCFNMIKMESCASGISRRKESQTSLYSTPQHSHSISGQAHHTPEKGISGNLCRGHHTTNHHIPIEEDFLRYQPVLPWQFLLYFLGFLVSEVFTKHPINCGHLPYVLMDIVSSWILALTLTSSQPPSFCLICSPRVLDMEWNPPWMLRDFLVLTRVASANLLTQQSIWQ